MLVFGLVLIAVLAHVSALVKAAIYTITTH